MLPRGVRGDGLPIEIAIVPAILHQGDLTGGLFLQILLQHGITPVYGAAKAGTVGDRKIVLFS